MLFTVTKDNINEAIDNAIAHLRVAEENCKRAKGVRPSERAFELSDYYREIACLMAVREMMQHRMGPSDTVTQDVVVK